MIPAPYFQVLQIIVVQNTVIYPLASSTFPVNIFVLFGIPRDTWMETQVTMFFDINRTTIAAGGTCFGIRTGIKTPAFKGTAVFMCVF